MTTRGGRSRFGEQRLVRPDVARGARLLYRAMGVADPAHWLHARYMQDALRRSSDCQPRSILDAGCGRGDYSFYLARSYPDAQVLGIDVDRDLVRRNIDTARRMNLSNVRFEVADLVEALPHHAFDLVVCVDVLEHISNQSAAVANLYQSMTPGAVAFLHIPTVRPMPVLFSRRLNAFHEWAEDEHIAEELTAEQFTDRIVSAGFDVVAFRRTFGRYTGELATSIFALFFESTVLNRIAQAMVSPICRVLAMADSWNLDTPRYAVALTVSKPILAKAGQPDTNA